MTSPLMVIASSSAVRSVFPISKNSPSRKHILGPIGIIVNVTVVGNHQMVDTFHFHFHDHDRRVSEMKTHRKITYSHATSDGEEA